MTVRSLASRGRLLAALAFMTLPLQPAAGLRAQQLDPSSPSKEYIRLGGRVIAVVSPAPSGSFALAAAPSQVTVLAGASSPLTVSVTGISGFSGTVQLSIENLPANVTAAFDPATINGTGQSTLTVTTAASAEAGSYSLLIKGTSGASVQSVPITLLIGAFGITVSPGTQEGVAGFTANYTVTVTGSNGFSGNVDLSAANLPAGASGTFTPASLSISDSTPVTSQFSLITAADTPAGSYTFTVSGVSGALTRSASAGIAVQAGTSGLPSPDRKSVV